MIFRLLFSILILALIVSCAPQQATATPKAVEEDQGKANPTGFAIASGGLQFVEFYSDI